MASIANLVKALTIYLESLHLLWKYLLVTQKCCTILCHLRNIVKEPLSDVWNKVWTEQKDFFPGSKNTKNTNICFISVEYTMWQMRRYE